jgi:phospholipid N-methyltransferase
MRAPDLSRLHALRMENDAARYAQEEQRGRFNTIRNRHDNGTAPVAVSAYQLFQTPADLAGRMVALADPMTGLSWLEPSAGLGRILRPILATSPASVTACEVSPDLSGQLYGQFPGVVLWQGDFLSREPVPVFDRVAMNPPFHMRADIAHIRHALKFLKPGGVLVALCMATRHRAEAFQAMANHWELLPGSTFAAVMTKVETYLLTITRELKQ